METPIDMTAQAYRHLVHTLTTLLPPPPTDTPEAWQLRNHAAIAKVADLLPVNANEADLAAQCVAARAQAEDVLRSLRQHAGDIKLTMKLNAQYGTMVRTSLAAHGHLIRAQQLRHKREKRNADIDTDAWTRHIAARSMLEPLEATPAPAAPSQPEPEIESQDVGNETPARFPPTWHRRWDPAPREISLPVPIIAERPHNAHHAAALNS
jgi:hypothetical protein